MILAALWTTLDQEDPRALFTKQANNGINQGEYERVGGRFGKRQMEIEIRFDECIGIPYRLILPAGQSRGAESRAPTAPLARWLCSATEH